MNEAIKDIKGLSDDDVRMRLQQGQVNILHKDHQKTSRQIIMEQVFTLFHLVNVLIACALLYVRAYTNVIFIFIIIINAAIGIAQQLHAKHLIHQLSFINMPYVCVIRDHKQTKVEAQQLVMDDIMVLKSGMQIACDAIIVQGKIEVNEALLTGESDGVQKGIGELLLSGSSVISGACYAKVIHVGDDNYSASIIKEAQQMKENDSKLLQAMKKITRLTSVLIIPLGLILFWQARFLRHDLLADALVHSTAGLLGMLPKGLLLLTSVSLAAGVSRLAKKKLLIQNLYALETLARVDTLCLDKTGTITCGVLTVEDAYYYGTEEQDLNDRYIRSYLYYSEERNATYQALCDHFHADNEYQPAANIPFSSKHKYSVMYFAGYGSLFAGGADILCDQLPVNIIKKMEEGKRVLVIARSDQKIMQIQKLPQLELLYIIVMQDTIREGVKETLSYFAQEHVDVKIISGDHVKTVSAIALQAGLSTWDSMIDMKTVKEADIAAAASSYSVFGRVTPLQKKQLIKALRDQGHTVAMSGDGVNDILALKEADCSIAIAQGSDAVKQMSQIVLMSSQFSSLYDVVMEGRRVVNNVTRIAGVFFIKTLYSMLIAFICAIFRMPFPFIPIQITLIDVIIEAFPAFLTMMERDDRKIKDDFLKIVLKKALPSALAITYCTTILMIMMRQGAIGELQAHTMMYLCVACISMFALITSFQPINHYRMLISMTMVLLFFSVIICFPSLFQMASLNHAQQGMLMMLIVSSLFFRKWLTLVFQKSCCI